jgi:5'-methylthioadenosine phosphorylase
MIKVGIIGGSGFYDFDFLSKEGEVLKTPFGSAQLFKGEFEGREIYFLPRHGKGHRFPPHLINYRANIWALKEKGVQRILATSAVGSLKEEVKPGTFVLPDQFIDFTKGRESTFFQEGEVYHVDLTEPYCPELRSLIADVCRDEGIEIVPKGTYVCTEGPRFETKAEIKAFSLLGGDLVGMTGYPEVALAREAEICYASLAIVTNLAAGISGEKITAEEVMEMMGEKIEFARRIFLKVIGSLSEERKCTCSEALKGAKAT